MDYIELLPAELLIKIFSNLSMRDIVRGVIPVNKRLYEICNWDNDLWQLLFRKTFGSVEWFLLITFMQENEKYDSWSRFRRTDIVPDASAVSIPLHQLLELEDLHHLCPLIHWKSAFVKEYVFAFSFFREQQIDAHLYKSQGWSDGNYSLETHVIVLLFEDLDTNYLGERVFVGAVKNKLFSPAYGPTLDNKFPFYAVSLFETNKDYTNPTKLLDHLLVPFHRLQALEPLVPDKAKSPFAIYVDQHDLTKENVRSLWGTQELHKEWSQLTNEKREKYVKASEEAKKWWRRKTKLCDYYWGIKISL